MVQWMRFNFGMMLSCSWDNLLYPRIILSCPQPSYVVLGHSLILSGNGLSCPGIILSGPWGNIVLSLGYCEFMG